MSDWGVSQHTVLYASSSAVRGKVHPVLAEPIRPPVGGLTDADNDTAPSVNTPTAGGMAEWPKSRNLNNDIKLH